jgi:hypothetical protein
MPILTPVRKRSIPAPVSHQKQPDRSATNAIESKQNRSKINKADRYPAAHNGLVAGSSPAGPTIRLFFSVLIIHDYFSYLFQAILQL